MGKHNPADRSDSYLPFSLRLVLCLLAGNLLLIDAANIPPPPIVRLMEAKYRAANTLQATFLERYCENGSLVRAESGTAYFRKPGKMRWEYEQPEKNLFLVDGKFAWFYTPVDHTATKVPARESDDWRTPLALLAGETKLSRVCDHVNITTMPKLSVAEIAADGVAVECVLKDAQGNSSSDTRKDPLPRVFLEILPHGELSRIVIQSSGSVLIEFSFKDWEINPPLAEALFRFNPPPGVVIVDGLLSSSPNVRQ
jgi:outer membrane lipoprotein carrier protein